MRLSILQVILALIVQSWLAAVLLFVFRHIPRYIFDSLICVKFLKFVVIKKNTHTNRLCLLF